jgi:predicted ATPase/DNA-binding winged helix-turn-helix (wHTH) protein
VRFRFGAFQLDDERYTLTGPAGAVHVEPQVFELLHQLVLNHDRVVSKEELLDTIWGDRFVSESALTSRVKAARRAVGDDGQAQQVIRTVHARGYQFVAPVVTDADRGGASLPRLRNALLGRTADVDGMVDRFRDARLVTITGAGGIGKTTVAVAVAERVRADYDDGAVFVDLSPLEPDAELTRAVAEAAGLEGAASETVERIAEHLAHRAVLVVLDNCEHVLAGAARLVDLLLARGDAARVLATSREPLGVAGEHVWPLGPLFDDGPALFVERARAAEPRVAWDPADPAVVAVCRRLDHVPLALELAAGQLRRFDIAELARRLDDRLGLLSGRAGAVTPRHTTMATAIDWSYQLLDGAEQDLLCHLSTFPSSFDLASAEAVAPPLEDEAITVFGRLVDKSLVVRQPGTGRYRLLETIRMFARDRLDDAGGRPAAFERHRRLVCERAVSTTRLDRWLSARAAAGYRLDLDDARQAFRASVHDGHVADAVEIAVGASFLWRNAMGHTEGERWAGDLVALDLSPQDRLWVDILRADVGQGRGDQRQMLDAATAAGVLVDSVVDPAGACLATHYAALAHFIDADRARRHLDDALELAHRSGDPRLATLIEAFQALADVTTGQGDRARHAVDRLDQVASEDGYERFILHWVGWMLALSERDGATARRWMGLQQDFLDRTGIVETWITSFSTAMCDAVDGGDLPVALARTLALADREGYAADADCVLVLAYAALCAGQVDAAAELVGTAVAGRFNTTAHYVLYLATLDGPLRRQLGPEAMARAAARGRSRTAAAALAAHGIDHRGRRGTPR